MDLQTIPPVRKSVTFAEYVSGLAQHGKRMMSGKGRTAWLQYEPGAMVRIPTFDLSPPISREVFDLLWTQWAVVVSYIVKPDIHHPANAFLYVCSDQDYLLDKLSPAVRRNIRRGLRELRIASVSYDELMSRGSVAFADTVRRIGLNGGEAKDLQRYFSLRARCPGHSCLGAWKNNQLAAFLPVTEVDDWVEFDSCFSMDAFLPLRSNDALIFSALSHYLTEVRCRLVSFGLSSVQEESNKDGLHSFKTKLGFEARPVRRVFVLHPLLRPFANRLTLWSLNVALRFMPSERRLKKAGGVLTCLLGRASAPEFGKENRQ